MPPQIKFAQAILLNNAARGHVNLAAGQAIIRWTCNPPPPPGMFRKRTALAKLRGGTIPFRVVEGSGKRKEARA